jgi:hypothetical protein
MFETSTGCPANTATSAYCPARDDRDRRPVVTDVDREDPARSRISAFDGVAAT